MNLRSIFSTSLLIFASLTAYADDIAKETYTYKMVGDSSILADVYAAVGTEPKPVVIWIHGGGLAFGTRMWMPEQQLKRYHEAGFVVVSIDHRLIPETKIPEIIEDVEAAYEWVRSEGPGLFDADPERIAFIGHSSGGYLALMAGVVLEPKPKAIISVYGFGDLTGDWTVLPNEYFNQQPAISEADARAVVGTPNISSGSVQYSPQKRPKFFAYTKQQGIWGFEATGHDPATEPEWFKPYEPLKNIGSDFPATMIVHGDLDTDVPIAQAYILADVLKEHSVTHSLITNSTWGHLFDLQAPMDSEIQATFDYMLAFLKSNL
jgi:acetyl esterase/lipase